MFSDLWELVVSASRSVCKDVPFHRWYQPSESYLSAIDREGSLSLLANFSSSPEIKHGDSDDSDLLVRLGLTRGGDTGSVFALSLALAPRS